MYNFKNYFNQETMCTIGENKDPSQMCQCNRSGAINKLPNKDINIYGKLEKSLLQCSNIV